MSLSAIVYDIEIVKAIPSIREPAIEGIQYCDGWGDHKGMGISVIGCYDLQEKTTRVFCQDNFDVFAKLCAQRELLVGFNSIPFDNAVLRANGIDLPESKCYDLLREIWLAAGLSQSFRPATHGGYGLDAVCQTNYGLNKSGNGALAPVLWQQGKIGQVLDYCLNDISMTVRLFDDAFFNKSIKCPKTGRLLLLRHPHNVIARRKEPDVAIRSRA